MAISDREGYVHEGKWMYANIELNRIGFWVKWQRDFYTDQYKYALGKRGEHMPMGIYNEEEAKGMVKMLLSNAKHEEP